MTRVALENKNEDEFTYRGVTYVAVESIACMRCALLNGLKCSIKVPTRPPCVSGLRRDGLSVSFIVKR